MGLSENEKGKDELDCTRLDRTGLEKLIAYEYWTELELEWKMNLKHVGLRASFSLSWKIGMILSL